MSPGRCVNVNDLAPGRKVEPRPIVLKHGGPTPVPVLPATDAANGSQLAENSPEVQALHASREAFYGRLQTLRAAGMPTQHAIGLLG